MADIRINALTEASASVTTDFLPIDGGTGTRKLSAYSPTFGGNATVSGTLTVSGSGNSSVAGKLFVGTLAGGDATYRGDVALLQAGSAAAGAGGLEWKVDAGGSGYGYRQLAVFDGVSAYNLTLQSRSNSASWTTAQTITPSGSVTISSTTASTAYNSGALVVSGGVGIAGALYSQQNTNGILAGAYFENASTGNAATIRHRLTAGASTCDIEAYGSGHASFANRLRLGTSNGQIDFVPAGVNTVGINNNTVSILASTTSNNTSSGALVVSGGVGVAGAIYAGARIQSAVDLVVDAGSGSANAALYLAGRNSGTQNLVTIQSNFEGALTITPKAGQGTTIASSLTTAAPSGGTAAAWKLGTVATVSPTSPNRTIEVDIGGTIYYIHAKTTNN